MRHATYSPFRKLRLDWRCRKTLSTSAVKLLGESAVVLGGHYENRVGACSLGLANATPTLDDLSCREVSFASSQRVGRCSVVRRTLLNCASRRCRELPRFFVVPAGR